MPELLEEQRENWGTRAGFVLAAIGSAVGLGNLWGFPYHLYSHGGGAFLVPYVIGMVLIGIPVLILEFSLGHMTQRAAPDAFRGVNRRSEPLGWLGIGLGFIIITFYAVILAWCLHFLIVSIQGIFSGGELPWKGEGIEGVENAKNYFYNTLLSKWPEDEASPWAFGPLSMPVVWCLISVWLMIYLCIFRGVKLVSRIVLWTVPLPWLMLLILTIRGLTLPGAAAGMEYYLKPDWSQLAKPDTWQFAFSQVFFSMSLAFGVMATYASFLHRKSDLNNNATIIGLSDLGTSFIAGIAVFATLGAMAVVTGEAVPTVAMHGKSSLGMAFVALPYALAQFPASAWFSTVLFFALITLGIDSAFSIAESVLAAVVDKTRWSRAWTLILLSLVGAAAGLIYCTRGGLTWFGNIADKCVFGPWGITMVGLLQCVVLGWMYRISRLRRHANERSDWKLGAWWDWLIRIVVPLLLAALFAWSLLDVFNKGYLFTGDQLNPASLTAVILSALAAILAFVLSAIHSPGADTHAAHKDQPTGKRLGGQIGTLLAVASLALVVYGFALTLEAKGDFNDTTGLGAVGKSAVMDGRGILTYGVIAGAIGLALGTAGVVGSEAGGRRPSRWARGAASISVLTTGGAAGLLLAGWVMTFTAPASTAEGAAAAEAGAALPAAGTVELSGTSFAVMAIMLGLIFGGLLWCFYRALKAAGGEATEQAAEGMDNTEGRSR